MIMISALIERPSINSQHWNEYNAYTEDVPGFHVLGMNLISVFLLMQLKIEKGFPSAQHFVQYFITFLYLHPA